MHLLFFRYLCKENDDHCSANHNTSRDSVTSSVDLDESSYRPRSMLSEAQRRVLEEAYATDPWPSRSQLQELTRKTDGLSRRVIQVWFQNCRARDRRKGRNIPERPGGTRPGINIYCLLINPPPPPSPSQGILCDNSWSYMEALVVQW